MSKKFSEHHFGTYIINGAELMGAVGALAPTVFLPRPEIIHISVPLFLPRPEVVLILAPTLFTPVRRHWKYFNICHILKCNNLGAFKQA